MRRMTGSTLLRVAANQGRITRADSGSGSSTLKLYTGSGGTLLAVLHFAKPCGTITVAGRLSLERNVELDLVLASGSATYAVWCDGDGAALSADHVTDEAGMQSDGSGGLIDSGDIGPWVLKGTAGTMVYEGGIVALISGLMG